MSIETGGLQTMLLRELGFPRGAQVSIGSKEEADWGRLPPRLHSRQSHFLSSVLHIVFHVTFFFLIKAFGCFFKKCFFSKPQIHPNTFVSDGETEALRAAACPKSCSPLETELGSVPDCPPHPRLGSPRISLPTHHLHPQLSNMKQI